MTPNASNLVKKADYNTKTSEIENKITTVHNHGKYITTQHFDKLTSEIFSARLAKANLASKNDITDVVKKTDFDEKLRNLNENVTSNKAKHILVENELNDLLEKVQVILTKNFINKFSILNEAKCFSSGMFQYYLVFMQTKKYINFFSGTTRIYL